MSAQPVLVSSREAHLAREFFQILLRDYRPRRFAVRLWNEEVIPAGPGVPVKFTLVIRSPGALRRMFLPPDWIKLGECFVSGDFDVEGNLEAAIPFAEWLTTHPWTTAAKLRMARWLLQLPKTPPKETMPRPFLVGRLHSLGRDRAAVQSHYDVSNEFYALWLDRRMVYSCAYFTDPGDDLDSAQQRKLEYICRKLRLRPGDRLLDIGCGWGGLILYAARHYGVHAVGVTLSARQLEYTRERIAQEKLEATCHVELTDYRQLQGRAQFDKIASVGMFEHVGASQLGDYFRHAARLLTPGGAFLNHGIATRWTVLPGVRPLFQQQVFPDTEMVPLSATLWAAESAGFEVRDVESLREHYALTLRHWVSRLEARASQARGAAGERAYRLWRLYMAGAAHYFTTGDYNVYQTLLLQPRRAASGLPLTREDWYR